MMETKTDELLKQNIQLNQRILAELRRIREYLKNIERVVVDGNVRER